MCGIAGLITRQTTPEPTRQREMLAKMAGLLCHRGPDDEGIHIDGQVGLAHTRLSIIDIDGGHQPLFSADKNLSLIANGEIYNYIELQQALSAQGRQFTTNSDSETILQAYASYGRDFLQHLHGMFAFALHDKQKQRLILARDRLGIKPLFYTVLPDRVVFASEIKALLSQLPHTPEINPEAFIQYLQSQFNTGRETIIKGVHRLLPGEALAIDANLKLRHWHYWSALDIKPSEIDFHEASMQFDTLFETVMREHMRSDVPYGLFLSGGVDSAILLAMLDRLQDRPIRSFSVGFSDVKMADELDDAKRMAKHFNTQHTPLTLSREAVFNTLPHTVWAADDLMRDYASLPTSVLAQHAARELKVVFSGEGGDEVFAGYGRYRKARPERWLRNLIMPGSGGFRTRGHWQHRWSSRLFGAELKAAKTAVRAPYINAWQATPKGWTDIQRSQYTDLSTALPDNLLVKADRMLMAHGLEGRVPFLDHRVVEFGMSLPDQLKVDSRGGKAFLKRWAEQFLPADHLYRKKRGFHVPVREWLYGPFLDKLANKLTHNTAIKTWFRAESVKQILEQQRTGHNASLEIWGMMQFAIWHRLFIEQPGTRPTEQEDPLDWIS